jgi:hypothetical protein
MLKAPMDEATRNANVELALSDQVRFSQIQAD